MKTLTKSDYEAASQMIGCEVETIQAIINIEFPDPGFILDGDKNRLALRFNRQRFHHFTEGVHDKRNSISSPKPDVKPRHKSYDGRILAEIERFNEAEKLDEAAAKRAALWGRFRIEGFLHRACGYSTIDGMIADFARAGEPARALASGRGPASGRTHRCQPVVDGRARCHPLRRAHSNDAAIAT